MTGAYFSTSFSLLLTVLVTAVLFVYARMRPHTGTRMTYNNVDLMAGDEGED